MSTRMLSDDNATPTVTDTYNYDAFGEQMNASLGTTNNNYLYTGEQFDSDANLERNSASTRSSDTPSAAIRTIR